MKEEIQDEQIPAKLIDNANVNFDILYLVESEHLDVITNDFLDHLRHKCYLKRIEFDGAVRLPDIDGKILRISGDSLNRKRKACEIVIKEINHYSPKSKRRDMKRFDHCYKFSSPKTDDSHSKHERTNIILIPEGLVSLVIGAKGKRIKSLVYKTYTKIVVSQPIFGLTHRAVTIKGYYKDVCKAIF